MEIKVLETGYTQISMSLALAFGVSVLVLLLGRLLTKKISFLQSFCIPAPVTGGTIFALVNLIMYTNFKTYISFDNTLQSFFMLCFFTTVGFNANFSILKKAGIGVIIFLLLATLLCVVQNGVGVGLAMMLKQNPLLGIATGSVPLTGGHGTSGAQGLILEEAGLDNALTICLAAATFGLVSGSLLGGPVAKMLIEKYKLKPKTNNSKASSSDIFDDKDVILESKNISNAFFQIAIAVGFGSIVSIGFDKLFLLILPDQKVKLPVYIGGMLVAVFMANIFGYKGKNGIRIKEIAALGDAFLAVFLSQALMSLKLWELREIAGPIIIILAVQVVVMILFAIFVTFIFMGKDYDAAVLTAGHCGFGMGATPNGVANMTAVVERYFPSPKAFMILPIVGGMFIDFTNIAVITIFTNIFK